MSENLEQRRLAAFFLGDTRCMCVTTNLDAVTESPKNFRIFPGTKPYFSGNARLGRDLVSYFHLPTFFGLAGQKSEASQDEHPTDFVPRDPLSPSMVGLHTDGIVAFVPVIELKDADPAGLSIPSKLAPYCTGVVEYQGAMWALVCLETIIRDNNFRSVELPA